MHCIELYFEWDSDGDCGEIEVSKGITFFAVLEIISFTIHQQMLEALVYAYIVYYDS